MAHKDDILGNWLTVTQSNFNQLPKSHKRVTPHTTTNLYKRYFHNFKRIVGDYDNAIQAYNRFVQAIEPKRQHYFIKSFEIKSNTLFKVEYEKDKSTYTHIDKRKSFRDYSPGQILKVLRFSNKITKSQYRHSKTALENGNPLKTSILEKYNIYLRTVKIDKNKTFKRLETQATKDTTRINFAGLTYIVPLKTYTTKRLNTITKSTFLNQNTKLKHVIKIGDKIQNEFKRKIHNNNIFKYAIHI